MNMKYAGIDITENEGRALVACLNYNDIEDQLDDNYSNGGPDEFAELLGWNKKQVGGLISSLEKKGLGFEEPVENGLEEYSIFWLSELGVRVAFAFSESRA